MVHETPASKLNSGCSNTDVGNRSGQVVWASPAFEISSGGREAEWRQQRRWQQQSVLEGPHDLGASVLVHLAHLTTL